MSSKNKTNKENIRPSKRKTRIKIDLEGLVTKGPRRYLRSTIKRKETEKSPPRKKIPSIVLYISAHGQQTNIPLSDKLNTEILSYVPFYGECGIMTEYPLSQFISPEKPKPPMHFNDLLSKLQSNKTDTSTEAPNITKSPLFGQYKDLPLDELAFKIVYDEFAKYKTQKPENIDTAFYNLIYKIKMLYSCITMGVDAPDYYYHPALLFQKGVKIVKPRFDRNFYFEPNDDESYKNGAHYGLHIISVGDLNDHLRKYFGNFQPDKNTGEDFDFDYGNIGNIKLEFFDNKNYGENKIDIEEMNQETIINAIRNIQNSGENRYKRVICEKIYDRLLQDKFSTLSDIYLLFRFIGFEKIYFIDPTCRSFCSSKSGCQHKIAILRKPSIPFINDIIVKEIPDIEISTEKCQYELDKIIKNKLEGSHIADSYTSPATPSLNRETDYKKSLKPKSAKEPINTSDWSVKDWHKHVFINKFKPNTPSNSSIIYNYIDQIDS